VADMLEEDAAGVPANRSRSCFKIDASYAYLGWTLDRLDDPLRPPVPFTTFGNIAAAAPAFEFALPTEGYVAEQFGAAIDALFGEAIALVGGQNPLIPDALELQALADKDMDVTYLGTGVDGQMIGNGGTGKIYRFREGVERFMITDINNPGASAMAQSTLWMMMDLFGGSAAIPYFNHIPGGCNVLFLDGHVEFIRYVAGQPGPGMDSGATAPVLPSIGYMIGLLTGIN
jgi:prepilin-type processing-associated H-X9-DG protein